MQTPPIRMLACRTRALGARPSSPWDLIERPVEGWADGTPDFGPDPYDALEPWVDIGAALPGTISGEPFWWRVEIELGGAAILRSLGGTNGEDLTIAFLGRHLGHGIIGVVYESDSGVIFGGYRVEFSYTQTYALETTEPSP